MGLENGLYNDANEEAATSASLESKESAEDELNALLKQIEEDGGIEGSNGKYTFDQIKAQVDLALITRGKNLDRVTNTKKLREKLSAAIKEKNEIDSLKRVPQKKEPINWNDGADDLQRLDEEDRRRHGLL